MSFHSRLQELRSALAPRRSRRDPGRPNSLRAGAHRLNLEALEDRCLLSFGPAASFPAGASPRVVVTADFNTDGRLDLATTNYDGTVSVLLGDGLGGFGAASRLDAGTLGRSLAVGDFNNDTHLDLATIGFGQPNAVGVSFAELDVLAGHGDGTFQSPAKTALQNASPLSVAVGDFDGDGNSDLACTFQSMEGYGTIQVLLGDGLGGFAESTLRELQGFYPQGLAVAKLTAGGGFDVVTADYNAGTVSVLLGYGGGLLDVERVFATGQSPVGVAVGDFTGDGIPDLVTAGLAVDVLPGLGDGWFGSPIQHAVNGPGQTSVATGDFNGDGMLDIVTADPGAGIVSVLLGRGNGAFAPPIDHAAGSAPRAVAVGDFNGDGRPDAAAAARDSNAVSVLLNDGSWSVERTAIIALSGFPSPATAGVVGSFTVTARDDAGNLDAGYAGAVNFVSSDPLAVLPADYTFTAADAGTHTFTAALKTAGSQSITATTVGSNAGTGIQAGIIVNPATMSQLSVAGFPSPTTAGVAGSFAVTARDPYGNRATDYRGTVRVTSSDATAALPADAIFTAADAGVHTFVATLKRAGSQSLTAKDTLAAAILGSQAVMVYPAAASRLVIGAPASVKVKAQFNLTVTVVDAYGNVVTGFRGTLSFASSDSTASLPVSYTFTTADRGVHTFTKLVLKKRGKQTITVTDTQNRALTGSTIINVL